MDRNCVRKPIVFGILAFIILSSVGNSIATFNSSPHIGYFSKDNKYDSQVINMAFNVDMWVKDGDNWVNNIEAPIGTNLEFKIEVTGIGGFLTVTAVLPNLVEYNIGSADPPWTIHDRNDQGLEFLAWMIIPFYNPPPIYFDGQIKMVGISEVKATGVALVPKNSGSDIVGVTGINNPPTAHIDSIIPNPANQGQTVTFTGHGTDPDTGDTITGYNWRSTIDGQLSTAASFSSSTLSVETHTIYFKVKDNHDAWSLEVSGALTINAVNKPPNTPSSPSPANHATGVDVNADLSWTGGDPDTGDTLTYDLYFDTVTPPTLANTGLISSSFDPGTMSASTTYYWQILSWDNHGASTAGPIWDFTTTGATNNPPNAPSNPNPANHATGIDVNADLSWTCSDPDTGDTLTYDVYFGTTTSPSLVSNGQTGSSYDPGTMNPGTKYYWKIDSWDNHGATTPGPLWDFTTASGSNNPPNTPSKPFGPTSGKAGTEYTYTSITTDPNDDDVFYLFDWDDGTDSGWLGPYGSGDTVTASNTWTQEGSYQIKVKAKDVHIAESEWSDPLAISMPKNKAINPFILFLERLIERFPILEQILQPIYDKLTGF